MGFSAVTLRDSMERPEALEAGSIIMTGLNPENLVRSIEQELSLDRAMSYPEGYESQAFSIKVLRFFISTCSLVGEWKGIR